MNCKYFGTCASCTLFDKSYDEQLNYKIKREKERFSDLTTIDFDIIKSHDKNFRNRAEFRIWWEKDTNGNEILSYAMNDFKKNILKIDSCEMVSPHIQEIMPKLIFELEKDLILSYKLFAVLQIKRPSCNHLLFIICKTSHFCQYFFCFLVQNH